MEEKLEAAEADLERERQLNNSIRQARSHRLAPALFARLPRSYRWAAARAPEVPEAHKLKRLGRVLSWRCLYGLEAWAGRCSPRPWHARSISPAPSKLSS